MKQWQVKEAQRILGLTNLELSAVCGCGERTIERLRAHGGDGPVAILICVLAKTVTLGELRAKAGYATDM